MCEMFRVSVKLVTCHTEDISYRSFIVVMTCAFHMNRSSVLKLFSSTIYNNKLCYGQQMSFSQFLKLITRTIFFHFYEIAIRLCHHIFIEKRSVLKTNTNELFLNFIAKLARNETDDSFKLCPKK